MSDYNFGPAAPEEETVYGACRPGRFSGRETDGAVDDWVTYVRSQGVGRVCCLLDDEHLDHYDNLLGQYRRAFGPDRVRHVPVSDFSVVNPEAFHERIMPFLRAADEQSEPAVVHCSAGQGRTGHVLALWLVHGRGYDVETAVETIEATGRTPMEAVDFADLERI